MSPKAEAEPAVKRAAAPKSTITKNAQLDIKPMKSKSQATFADLDEEVEYLKVLYWGREGSAKSTNAAMIANLGPTVFVNAEGGAKKRALTKRGVNTANLKVWPPKRTTSITISGLQALHDQIKSDLANDPESWAGVVFDSTTEIVQALTGQVSDHRIARAEKNNVTIDEVDQYFTDVADYGTMTKMFMDILRQFRDLPIHVVYTALERRDVDKNSGDVTLGPAVTPGVSTPLLGYVDIVINTVDSDEDNPYRGLTKNGGIRRVKDRFDVLPRVMAYPNMERIIAYANGEFDEEVDPLQSEIAPPKPKRSGKLPKKGKSAAAAEELVPTDSDSN